MPWDEQVDLTGLLNRAVGGDDEAREAAFWVLYEELRAMAAAQMKGEVCSHTWESGDLLHECYAELFGKGKLGEVKDRRYFFGAVAQMMQRLLIDHARRNKAQKRGGEWKRTPLDEQADRIEREGLNTDEFEEVFAQLKALNERQHTVVQLRFFGQLGWKQVSAALGIHESTARADFDKARAFLYVHLQVD